MIIRFYQFAVFCACLCMNVYAQSPGQLFPSIPNATWGPAKITVKVDPQTRIPIGDIPFDRCFVLRLYFDTKVSPITEGWLLTSYFGPAGVSNFQLPIYGPFLKDVDADDEYLKRGYKAYEFILPPLAPNQIFNILLLSQIDAPIANVYFRVFQFLHDGKASEAKALNDSLRSKIGPAEAYPYISKYYGDNKLHEIFDSYDTNIEGARAAIIKKMQERTFVTSTDDAGRPNQVYLFDFSSSDNSQPLNTIPSTVETSAPFKIVADAGLIVCGFHKGFTEVTPYVGINYSFRYLDSDIPFRLLKNRLKFYQRLSINAGLTLTSLAKDKFRSDIFGSNNIMLGGGYKLSHVFFVSAGTVIYNKLDPNPLLDKKKVSFIPYMGLSINLKISDALGDIAKVFSYGK